jgi:hypothetical protein
MADELPAPHPGNQRAWDEHNLSQLKYFQSLSLREKLEAVEGMADVVRRLREMRARGELRAAHGAVAQTDHNIG